MAETSSTYWVCVDCYVLHVNGETSPDVNPETLWSTLEDGQTVTAGIFNEAHSCGREHGEDIDECDCDHDDFSSVPCDGCDSYLAGARYACTVWTPINESGK